jgi:hypothetical protein
MHLFPAWFLIANSNSNGVISGIGAAVALIAAVIAMLVGTALIDQRSASRKSK